MNFAYRLFSLSLFPDAVLVDGSFVTAREVPGDVDFVFLIRPETINQALEVQEDEHDKIAIIELFQDGNQVSIRNFTGTHFLYAIDDCDFYGWANYFQFTLREPDPRRDPPWVRLPFGKGILYLDGGELIHAFGN